MSKVVSIFNKIRFANDETHMPVTMEQFQELTNEILTEFNKLADPNFLSGDYMAQILMSALHAYDHKVGYIRKSEVFESCINRVSCHVTFHAVKEIQKRLNPEAPALDGTEDITTPVESAATVEQETKAAI